MIDRYIRKTLDSGEIQEFEYQMPVPNRGISDFEARMVVSGKDEVIAFVRDITERKLAELKIKESEEKYKTFLRMSLLELVLPIWQATLFLLMMRYLNLVVIPVMI